MVVVPFSNIVDIRVRKVCQVSCIFRTIYCGTLVKTMPSLAEASVGKRKSRTMLLVDERYLHIFLGKCARRILNCLEWENNVLCSKSTKWTNIIAIHARLNGTSPLKHTQCIENRPAVVVQTTSTL